MTDLTVKPVNDKSYAFDVTYHQDKQYINLHVQFNSSDYNQAIKTLYQNISDIITIEPIYEVPWEAINLGVAKVNENYTWSPLPDTKDPNLPESIYHFSNGWQCQICTQRFVQTFHNIEQGQGCPTCEEKK